LTLRTRVWHCRIDVLLHPLGALVGVTALGNGTALRIVRCASWVAYPPSARSVSEQLPRLILS
jgi:hypothetical protein